MLAKLEYLNPGGSIKDRIGLPMIEAAERAGLLRPGRHDRRADLRQHRRRARDGRRSARLPLHLRDGRQAVAREDPAPARARRRGRRLPDRRRARRPAQLLLGLAAARRGDPERVQPEPVRQPGEPGDALRDDRARRSGSSSARSSTTSSWAWAPAAPSRASGATSRSGTPTITIVGADPEGSIYTGDVHSYLIEGVGEDFWPTTFDPAVVDRWVQVSDRDAFLCARRVAAAEGILIGGSGGMAVQAALQRGGGARRRTRRCS